MNLLYKFDKSITNISDNHHLRGIKRFCVEFFFFGLKNARACLFAGLFFLAIFCIPQNGIFNIPRYDLLLIIAICIQAFMLLARLESFDEFKAIMLFHVIGFVLEFYKTTITHSWSYDDFAYTKIGGCTFIFWFYVFCHW